MGQHNTLALRQRLGEEQIGTERGLDAVLYRQFVSVIRTSEYFKHFVPALTGEGQLILFGQKRLDAEPYALLGHVRRRRVVHQMGVLDTPCPRGNRSLDGFRDISVHGYYGVPVVANIDRGPKFGFGERRRVEWASR